MPRAIRLPHREDVMEALEAMRLTARERAAAGPKPSKKVWTPPDPARFRHGSVFALDQTLSHTGYTLVQSDHTGLWVRMGDVLDVKTDRKGFEETYHKAEQLAPRLNGLLFSATYWATDIVHEMPSVQGYRTESSLIAGLLIRQAAKDHARGVPVHTVSNQTMKTLLCPPGKRDEKKHVKAAVEALIPKDRRTTHRWNEHVHDAVALALTHLYDKDD